MNLDLRRAVRRAGPSSPSDARAKSSGGIGASGAPTEEIVPPVLMMQTFMRAPFWPSHSPAGRA